jgi:signal transduction histidine kinase
VSPRDKQVQDVRGQLVQAGFLVRLLALAYGLLGLVLDGGEGGLGAAALFSLLLLTSHLGLQHKRVRDLVVRHPLVALLDLVPVSLTPYVMGADSPLVLVAHTSALLVGVLFTIRTAVPLVLLLALTTALAGLHQGLSLVTALRDPVVLLSFAALGAAISRLSAQQTRAQQSSALAVQAAAAAEERLRLARDLHDTVAKSVQGVALTAAALPRWIDRDPDVARAQAGAVAAGARDAVSAARNLLSSLRLDDLDRPFADVVDEVVYRWEASTGIHAQRLVDDVPALPPGHRHELLCALTESLENVARHAPAARVTVSLDHLDGQVVVTVVDDGPGFLPAREEEAVAAGHYGLTGIRERLAGVGGSAQVRSAPGCGTQVRLEVAVEPAAQDAAAADAGAAGRGRPVRPVAAWTEGMA